MTREQVLEIRSRLGRVLEELDAILALPVESFDPEYTNIGTTVMVTPRTGPPYSERPPGGPHVPGDPPPTSNG